jgi:hypothetical protein
MKHVFIITLITVAAIIMSSCNGAPAEPTISAEDVQSTAVAAAFTAIAETQAAVPTETPSALPTDTPVTPTVTPIPTFGPSETPTASPGIESVVVPTFTSLPATSSNANNDPCNQPLGSVSGYPTKIKLVNKTKGSLVVSLYLNLTSFGECGYRGYTLAKNDALTVTDLVTGCYNVSVFVTEPNSSSKAFGYGCINNPDTWTFEISSDSVKFIGP